MGGRVGRLERHGAPGRTARLGGALPFFGGRAALTPSRDEVASKCGVLPYPKSPSGHRAPRVTLQVSNAYRATTRRKHNRLHGNRGAQFEHQAAEHPRSPNGDLGPLKIAGFSRVPR
jgi:hypothetical protein